MLKIAALIAAAGLSTVLGLLVTGIRRDGGGREQATLGVRTDTSTPRDGTEAAVVPLRISRLPPPPGARAPGARGCPTRGWVRGLGGADTQTIFTVHVEGLSDRTVIVDRAEVDVVRRHPPMRGTWVGCVGAGRQAVRRLSVDLDSTPARAVYTNDEGDPKRPRRFLFALGRGQVEEFLVVASGGRCWCTWRLRLGYTVRRRRRTLTIDDSGRPFETTGSSRAVGARYSNGWHALPPAPTPPGHVP
jgi:hypothetical protein